jgi:prepilin-type processing-associated H-X9-DG protein
MSRLLRFLPIAVVVIVLVGIALTYVMRSRVESDRVGCMNHLRLLGLYGVRHASAPGQPLPTSPNEELPPGTFQNASLKPDQRMSWYAYMLNVLDQGPPIEDPKVKHRRPVGLIDVLMRFDRNSAWDSPENSALANYRLTVAICPAQVPEVASGSPWTTNYIGCGGLGRQTPEQSIEEAGPNAGAYRYDGPTPTAMIQDGLRYTAQIVETNSELGPWLRGGPSTLRGLDADALPYIGTNRPLGGCHPGGVYVSMADGSVQFVKDTIDPMVFRAMWTIAGGPNEQTFDDP